ncbi:hypothetical protein HNY73_015578 [Argiope bruennichi]|uniref:Uncharacterized protein n=1 Tax=Argiope bruennichi TaxID=94029 RepID=A0A8T0ET23_ARGBR|nr:hypothetical protein HNY73_015578 [Argiope bruennichi]
MDDSGARILNYDTHTYTSYSYGTSEALDIAITSSEIFPQCLWSVLDTIGSDHSQSLSNQDRECRLLENSSETLKRLNGTHLDSVDNSMLFSSFSGDIKVDWKNFKSAILTSAKVFIPRGNVKRHVPYFTHYASTLKPLLDRRKLLFKSLNYSNSDLGTEINKINAEIKITYAKQKRFRWKEMCSNLDLRTNNSRLWRIVKSINKEQEQYEESNSVIDTNGQVFPDDKVVANSLATYYQAICKLVFTCE